MRLNSNKMATFLKTGARTGQREEWSICRRTWGDDVFVFDRMVTVEPGAGRLCSMFNGMPGEDRTLFNAVPNFGRTFAHPVRPRLELVRDAARCRLTLGILRRGGACRQEQRSDNDGDSAFV
jgi:hypothetical protein